MLERLVITLAIVGGISLLWFTWQYSKKRLIRAIPCSETPTGKPTLLYFSGDYCAICEMQQTPIINQLSVKLGEVASIETFDVACYPDAASKYKVLTLPTTVVLDPLGQVVNINYGLAHEAKLEKQLLSVEWSITSNIGVMKLA